MLDQQGWKDMESAPRDGRFVELRGPTGDVERGLWSDRSFWLMEEMFVGFDADFTGWREISTADGREPKQAD